MKLILLFSKEDTLYCSKESLFFLLQGSFDAKIILYSKTKLVNGLSQHERQKREMWSFALNLSLLLSFFSTSLRVTGIRVGVYEEAVCCSAGSLVIQTLIWRRSCCPGLTFRWGQAEITNERLSLGRCAWWVMIRDKERVHKDGHLQHSLVC